MPTAQASLRAVSPCRNGALRPYPASASTQPKRTPAAIARSISAKAISGLDRGIWYSTGTPARLKRTASLVQLSGRNSRNVSMTGTSPRASVSDTRVWQLAVLPNAEAYCAATPAECFCGPQDRPALTRRQGTSVAEPCDPIDPKTASESVQAPSANPISRLPWSAPPQADNPQVTEKLIWES